MDGNIARRDSRYLIVVELDLETSTMPIAVNQNINLLDSRPLGGCLALMTPVGGAD